ncbi:hypothetical protein F5Y16DRAFT_397039 [Xylariaceae sp. FL0255]|nr:hypothetical protein F5Y16DRAFT_397039 [Xylariaceae sp. FL0255]
MRFTTFFLGALATVAMASPTIEASSGNLVARVGDIIEVFTKCGCVTDGTCGCTGGKECFCYEGHPAKQAPCVKEGNCGCSGGAVGHCGKP